MECQEYQAIETPAGTFLPLDALLAALYRSCEIARPLRALLNELAALVPIHNLVTNHVQPRACSRRKPKHGVFA